MNSVPCAVHVLLLTSQAHLNPPPLISFFEFSFTVVHFFLWSLTEGLLRAESVILNPVEDFCFSF